MRRSILVLTAVASLGLLALGSAPASAAPAPLPEGDSLFGIACPHYSTDESTLPNMQLIKLDTATAEGTLVGSGTPALVDANCGGQGAWNPVTATAYALGQDFTDESDAVLVTIDTVSGVSTFVGDFAVSGVPVLVYSIAISPTGDAYAVGDTEDYTGFFKLDLDSGDLTLVDTVSYDNYTLAFDPSTGILYTLEDDGALYTVNTSTGVPTFVANVGIDYIYALAIDSSGTFWFTADVPAEPGSFLADLYSAELADLAGSVEFAGTVSVGETNPYTEALLLTYSAAVASPGSTPELAVTGATVEPVTVGAAFLMLLAGIAAVRIRRSRRA